MPSHGTNECNSVNAGAFWHFAFRLPNKRLQTIYNWIYHKYMRVKSQLGFIVKFCRVCVFIQLTILELGSFAYGNANKQKLQTSGFSLDVFSKMLRNILSQTRSHTHVQTCTQIHKMHCYGDVTVEHSILIHWSKFYSVSHLGASTMLWHIRLSPSSVCLYLCACD